MRIDVFCKVVDNWGDAGVCARLAADLAARGHAVRLAIDDAAPLAWMRPAPHAFEVVGWDAVDWTGVDLIVETFGAEPPPRYVAALADAARSCGRQPPWINLEYLSAEPYVERSHGLPSPILTGLAAGLVRHFFFPGFDPREGGLIREENFGTRQRDFDATAWRRAHGVPADAARIVSVFCYEPAPLSGWLAAIARSPQRTHLLVAAGRAETALKTALRGLFLNENSEEPRENGLGLLSISYQPLVSQDAFDERLWASDFNLVRGEDSLARAALAGKPFLWQAYPQDGGAQHPKIDALTHRLALPPSAQAAHAAWNGDDPIWSAGLAPLPDRPWIDTAAWVARDLLSRADLASRLIEFARHVVRKGGPS